MLAEPNSAVRNDRGRPRVLIVDDDRAFLRYAQRVLGDRYECRLAPDVETARAFLTAEPFDVMATDIHLPDGDGLDLLRLVSQASTAFPVVIVTGQPSIASAVEALRNDATDYLQKPAVDLDACIDRVLAKWQTRRASRQDPAEHARWAEQLRLIADNLAAIEAGTGVRTRTTPAVPASPDANSALWALLSPREAEVARRLMEGRSAAQIAEELGLSVSTVRNHIQAAFRRLGARSQLELLAKLRGTASR